MDPPRRSDTPGSNSLDGTLNTQNLSPRSKARAVAGQWAATAGQVVQQWSARKYTLPDKNVASQVLMYRQLLHTKCRPGLKLSREYQGTPAQKAVLHMPWWSKGIEETRKMEIAYDNLIQRLWLHGAIFPPQNAAASASAETDATTTNHADDDTDTLLDEEGMPPVPHDYWVSKLGFQQTDPVTDFRSGGVLSLAMLVWVVESCPNVFTRFVRPHGDASVLPFGITSINITDMMAKFLMLAKGVDRMDALLSQKPFWRMFADPNALLTCQELSMDLLADVVVELRTIRKCQAQLDAAQSDDEDLAPRTETNNSNISNDVENCTLVTVFDFAHILAVTEKRVEHDLLGAGPGTVRELRAIHQKLKTRYQHQLQQKLQRMQQQNEKVASSKANANADDNKKSPPEIQKVATKQLQNLQQHATGLGMAATSFAGNVFTKIKTGGGPNFNPLRRTSSSQQQHQQPELDEAVIFDSGAGKATNPSIKEATATAPTPAAAPATASAADEPNLISLESTDDAEGDWAGTELKGATEQIGNFSIIGDEDEAKFSIGDDDDDDE